MLEDRPAIDLQKMSFLAKKIIYSDEAHFEVGEYINKQNSRIWGVENPHAYIEKPTHQNESLFGADFGPFFFENERKGEAVTVNSDRYRAMLNEFLLIKIWFQQ